ncbi:MAG TPA: sensor domain-containing diguanylate cyclase [Synergistales bacterium]|nr:sensor domain-containing diguanylate cyclase [Synergistales bacterium]MDI9392343.1 sensor domain-containing diguanylate cyclase [Synergistota bacterium]HPD97804.1 sensor domain-containing diguanylate cyclase [Synergistales bacterium]
MPVDPQSITIPDIPEDIIAKWQGAVDVLARVVDVPVALVMKLSEPEIEVFISSETKGNPYHPGDSEHFDGSGLYCETVIKSRGRLLVPNALKDKKWCRNPDIKLGMVAYLGFPILYPDGTPFGTICVLDSDENHFGQWVERLMEQFRQLFELHLSLQQKNERLKESLADVSRLSSELEKAANTDPLTGLYNRRIFREIFERERSRHGRTGRPFCMIMGDLDGFKKINDIYGHSAGDQVLIKVARILEGRSRVHDYLLRWGGDEFLGLLPETSVDGGRSFAENVLEELEKSISGPDDPLAEISMCFGITGLMPGEDADGVISRCDSLLYEAKSCGRGRIGTVDDA